MAICTMAAVVAAAVIGPVHSPALQHLWLIRWQRRRKQSDGTTSRHSGSRYANGGRRGRWEVQPRTRLTRARRHARQPQHGATSTTERRGYEPIQHEHDRMANLSTIGVSPEAQRLKEGLDNRVSRALVVLGVFVGLQSVLVRARRTGSRAGLPPMA